MYEIWKNECTVKCFQQRIIKEMMDEWYKVDLQIEPFPLDLILWGDGWIFIFCFPWFFFLFSFFFSCCWKRDLLWSFRFWKFMVIYIHVCFFILTTKNTSLMISITSAVSLRSPGLKHEGLASPPPPLQPQIKKIKKILIKF